MYPPSPIRITPVSSPTAEIERLSYERGRKESKKDCEWDLKQYTELKQRVDDFEKGTGLKLDTWRPHADTINAVNSVLHGTIQSERKALYETAKRIIAEIEHS